MKNIYGQKNMSGKRAFTLIELLVVISIISLLSTIVLAAINSARDKGAIGAAQTFEGHSYSALYDDLLLSWDFDRDAVSPIQDQSGNGNSLVLNGATLSATPNPFKSGQVLAVDGGTSKTASLPAFQNPPTGEYSVSFWVYPTVALTGAVISSFSGITQNTFEFNVLDPNAGLAFRYRTGVLNFINSGPLALNKWYQVVGVCGNGKMGYYLNAKLISTASVSGCNLGANQINLAGNTPYYLDNVRIFKKALPLTLIQDRYLAELEKFQTLALKKGDSMK